MKTRPTILDKFFWVLIFSLVLFAIVKVATMATIDLGTKWVTCGTMGLILILELILFPSIFPRKDRSPD